MKAISGTDLQIGNSDISIKIYSAIEQETHLKQISACCGSPVAYARKCTGCGKELDYADIKKGVEIGSEIKEVNAENLKLENGNLKILGILKSETEEEGIFKDGSVWFIGYDLDKKNKVKSARNLMKFSYLREVLKIDGTSLIGLISMRGKEHIVLLKPYFNAIVGLGLYHFDRIRDVQEISGYSEKFICDREVLSQMAHSFADKETIAIKNIENTRNKLLEMELTKKEMGDTLQYNKKEENPLEICSF